jgi:chaperonin cofactor prefoldin
MGKGQFENYYGYVENESIHFMDDHADELRAEIDDSEVELCEFFDQAIHEHVDSDFIYVDLRDSADIIEQSDNVECDSGLWEGQEPVEAIKTQAFFTYRQDLMIEVIERAKEELNNYLDELTTDTEKLTEEMTDLENKIEDLQAEEDEEDGLVGEIETMEAELAVLEEQKDEIELRIEYISETIESN